VIDWLRDTNLCDRYRFEVRSGRHCNSYHERDNCSHAGNGSLVSTKLMFDESSGVEQKVTYQS